MKSMRELGIKRMRGVMDEYLSDTDCRQEAVLWLLTDLRHYCEFNHVDLFACLDESYLKYLQERNA